MYSRSCIYLHVYMLNAAESMQWSHELLWEVTCVHDSLHRTSLMRTLSVSRPQSCSAMVMCVTTHLQSEMNGGKEGGWEGRKVGGSEDEWVEGVWVGGWRE